MSILYESAREFGIELGDVQLERFDHYYGHLVEWNEKVNLTTITEYTDVQIKHFLDSLSVALALPRDALESGSARLIDIGAGAGFPGVPLAIAFPYLVVTLLEATGKKVIFLDFLTRELSLENATALKSRAEDLGHRPEHREQYDFAAARAVASLRTLAEYALPFVRVGGLFIAQKASAAAEESEDARRAIERLGGSVRELIPITLPMLDETRHLVVVEKISTTPATYPRRAGMPEKKPL